MTERLIDEDLPEDDGTFRTEPIQSSCHSAKQLFREPDMHAFYIRECIGCDYEDQSDEYIERGEEY